MNAVRLLFDENLSPNLVRLLTNEFPGSTHVDFAGLHGRSDSDVWNYARDQGLVLVSKDNDFRQLSFLKGAPPKVVWLHIGNASTAAVVELLRARQTDVGAFVQDAEAVLLAIEPGA